MNEAVVNTYETSEEEASIEETLTLFSETFHLSNTAQLIRQPVKRGKGNKISTPLLKDIYDK